jgi:hypothetical protein
MTMQDAERMSREKYARERSLEEQAYIDSQIAADQEAARKEQNRLSALKMNASFTPEQIASSLKAGEAVAAGRVAGRQAAKWAEEDAITPPKVVPVEGGKRWRLANTPQGKYDPNSEAPSVFAENQEGPDRRLQQVVNRPRTYGDAYREADNHGDRHEIQRQFFDARRKQITQQIYANAERIDPEFQDNYIKINLAKLDAAIPAMANIRAGEGFKSAQQEASRAGRLQNEYTITVLHNELALAKNALAKGDKEGAITFLQANVPKILQSLATGQSDAIQDSEARRLLPEMKALFEIPPWQMAEFFKNRGNFVKAFGTDVNAFIAKAEKIYAAGASALNLKYDMHYSNIGSAIADTGMQKFKTSVGNGPLDVKRTPADYQRILKDMGVAPAINLDPFQKPGQQVYQQGQSAMPSVDNAANLKLGRIVTPQGGSFTTGAAGYRTGY